MAYLWREVHLARSTCHAISGLGGHSTRIPVLLERESARAQTHPPTPMIMSRLALRRCTLSIHPNPRCHTWVVRVGGVDGEFRPWPYIYVYSIESRLTNPAGFITCEDPRPHAWSILISEAPRSGPFSLTPVSAKELKERAFQGVFGAFS